MNHKSLYKKGNIIPSHKKEERKDDSIQKRQSYFLDTWLVIAGFTITLCYHRIFCQRRTENRVSESTNTLASIALCELRLII